MADTKISALTELAAAPAAGDEVAIVDDSATETKRISVSNLLSYPHQEYMMPVWAEENAAIGANNYEWAFGNGANSPSDGGITIYVPTGWECHVVAMSLRIGSGTATVQLVHNGTSKGSDCNVAVSSGQSAVNEMSTPLAISNNDYINFRTQAASSSSGPNVVCAFLRYRET